MRNGYGGVLVQQELRDGQAHDVAAADHHGALAGERDAGLLEHLDDPLRGAGQHAGLLLPEGGDVQRMEAVHVLLAADGLDDLRFADVPGQGQLHQDAVHLGIGVEVADQRQKLLLGDVDRTAQGRIADADGLAGLRLAGYVAHAAGIFSHQNHDQMGYAPVTGRERLDLFGQRGLEFCGKFLSGDNSCHVLVDGYWTKLGKKIEISGISRSCFPESGYAPPGTGYLPARSRKVSIGLGVCLCGS